MEITPNFVSWFFHNSIRFKVNKVWLGDVGRHPLIVYRRFEKHTHSNIIPYQHSCVAKTSPGINVYAPSTVVHTIEKYSIRQVKLTIRQINLNHYLHVDSFETKKRICVV